MECETATVSRPHVPVGAKPKADRKIVAVSPRNGQALPAGPGRPKGQKSRLINLRDAVLEAFDQVGGVQYLAELARGTQSDRAAFCGLVAKVLPTQINQTVDGGIRLELGWLGGRAIGTSAAQNQPPQVQVVDLQRDERGKYQIVDPQAADPAAATPESPTRSGPAEGSETPAG